SGGVLAAVGGGRPWCGEDRRGGGGADQSPPPGDVAGWSPATGPPLVSMGLAYPPAPKVWLLRALTLSDGSANIHDMLEKHGHVADGSASGREVATARTDEFRLRPPALSETRTVRDPQNAGTQKGNPDASRLYRSPSGHSHRRQEADGGDDQRRDRGGLSHRRDLDLPSRIPAGERGLERRPPIREGSSGIPGWWFQ